MDVALDVASDAASDIASVGLSSVSLPSVGLPDFSFAKESRQDRQRAGGSGPIGFNAVLRLFEIQIFRLCENDLVLPFSAVLRSGSLTLP